MIFRTDFCRTLSLIPRESHSGHGQHVGDPDKIAQRTREERFLSPVVTVERSYIDEVIMPRATRRRVAGVLAMLRGKTVEMPVRGTNLPL
jgi:propionyl-CoA carboxylase beta chain